MKKIFTKKQILTIPNLLSFFRLILIPLIIWLYCVKQNYLMSVIILFISGLSDVVDGFVARKFNMVSDFGKILDPVADKLTQFAVIICLISRYYLMIIIAILFAVKELVMMLMGIKALQKNMVSGAKWHGKLNTVLLYLVVIILLLFPNINLVFANILMVINIIMMVISLILYMIFYKNLDKEAAKC